MVCVRRALTMDWQLIYVFALIGVLLILFLRELIPIPLTSMLAVVLLTGPGILTVNEGLAGFSSPATIAILSMFVLSAGIQQTGAMAAFTDRLASWAGKSHRKQIAAMSVASGPISGFVNNTPIVAVLIPTAARMARQAGMSPSRLLMVVSNMAMLGGLLTIVGTSTSLLGNAILDDMGIRPFSFFEFTWIGAAALALGFVYYMTVGPFILPDRGGGDAVERYDLKGFITEFDVPDESPAVGKTAREAGLSFMSGAQLLRITRKGERIEGDLARRVLQAGDRLLVEASRERMASLSEEGLNPVAPDPEKDHDLTTAEVVVTTGSNYIGRTIAQIDFRRRYQATVLAVRHQRKVELGPISKSRLSPGDVLLVQAAPDDIERMREKPNLFVTRERETTTYRKHRAPHAFLIVAAVVLVAALGWMHIATAALAGAVLMVITGCLRMDEFVSSIHLEVVLLIAGMIPVGLALEKTGGAQLIAEWMVTVGAGVPLFWLILLMFFTTSMITEVVSNSASVVLLLPIAVDASTILGIDPHAAALAVILAASTSMLTPVGYQTNTMIYAPGNYRFGDYFRVGAPLALGLTFLIPWLILLRYG